MPFIDFRLVRRVKQGDQAAFGLLYDRHGRKVYNLLKRLSADTAVAEDLTQETFLSAYRSIHAWRGLGSFSTWLCGIAVRCWRSHHRRSVPQEAIGEIEYADDPAALYLKSEERLALDDAIARLPFSLRETFVLVYVEGFSYKETAHLLEIPIGTVQSRLGRAKSMLQIRLAHIVSTEEALFEKGTSSHVV